MVCQELLYDQFILIPGKKTLDNQAVCVDIITVCNEADTNRKALQ